jgi:hypothetical protein
VNLIGTLMSISDNNIKEIINSREPLLRISPRAFTAIRTLSSWSSSMAVDRIDEVGRACYTCTRLYSHPGAFCCQSSLRVFGFSTV